MNESSGIVNTPVTHADDAAVKRQSMNERGSVWLIGNFNNNEPKIIVKRTETTTTRPGEKIFFLGILSLVDDPK